MELSNLFKLPDALSGEELITPLLKTAAFRVERIVSTGQKSPDGFFYSQEEDEFVVLLSGSAVLSVPDGRVSLKAGDFYFLPARLRHRVEYTSVEPPAIWLCIFGRPEEKRE